MSDFIPFPDVAALLPTQHGALGAALDAFRVVEEVTPFVEPVMTIFEAVDNPQVTLVSARGATGKSAMAAALSQRLRAPLWSLGEDKAVSGDAPTARLAAYLGVADPLVEIQRVPLLIIDAMDEARLRVTGVSWAEFMSSLGQYAKAGVHLVILGRNRTIEDVWYSLGEALPAVSWYEISHFTPGQQNDYVDLRALGAQGSTTEAYENAKKVVLEALNGATNSALDQAFAGYAPVLDAVAELLRPGENYQAVMNDFRASGAGGNRLRVLSQILDTLLLREKSKITALAGQLSVNPAAAYSSAEQMAWLASELLGASQPALSWCPDEKQSEYAERIKEFLHDHPFRDGEKWASPVFSSFVAYNTRDIAEPMALMAASSGSGLFFEFAATDDLCDSLVLDEYQFAALHSSLLAGQWATSTSLVSVRESVDSPEGSEIDSVSASLTLSHEESPTQVDATVLLSRPGHLELISPLASIDVEFGGDVVVRSLGSASIDLGPDVYIRAYSIDLTGSSMQISKDTSPTDVTGPTVELEVTEGLRSDATLIGSVLDVDFSIIAPRSVRLIYPWVRYRTAPANDDQDGSPDDRALRFLNKLMSLARRHGHKGERAVFIKKLQGRQGLESEDFRRAVEVLIDMGVADLRESLLFVNSEWDRHRYDGKGRPGMTSYEDKKQYWQPVLVAISEKLR